MQYTTEQYRQRITKQFARFPELFQEGIHVLVVVHNFPDPDALASAATFKYLAEELYKVKVSIGYGGNVGRAENKTLVIRTDCCGGYAAGRGKQYDKHKKKIQPHCGSSSAA
jgi:hypothetical protein